MTVVRGTEARRAIRGGGRFKQSVGGASIYMFVPLQLEIAGCNPRCLTRTAMEAACAAYNANHLWSRASLSLLVLDMCPAQISPSTVYYFFILFALALTLVTSILVFFCSEIK